MNSYDCINNLIDSDSDSEKNKTDYEIDNDLTITINNNSEDLVFRKNNHLITNPLSLNERAKFLAISLLGNISNQCIQIFSKERKHWQHEISCSNIFFSNSINFTSIKHYQHPNGKKKKNLKMQSSNFNKNDISIVLAIKNRQNRFNLFIRYYLQYCSDIKLIIIEAKSKNMLDVDNINSFNSKNNIIYKQVDIGQGFSLSKLRNFGIEECKTEFILFADVDFIFNEMFSKNIPYLLNTEEIQDSLIGLPVFETWFTFDERKVKIIRGQYDGYGACYIIKNKLVKKFKFDETNVHWGYEIRDLQKRLEENEINTFYLQYPDIPLYVLHYSHNQSSRRY